MEALIAQILGGVSGTGAYGLVLVILLLCGLGLPLPEDVVLITGGFLVFEGHARFWPMMVTAFVGILGGDTIAFMLGRHLGDRLFRRWPFRVLVTPSKRRKVEGLFARYGQKIVVAARFMPGVRAVTFFVAGGAGMKYPTFALFDGLAALVSAPLFVFLGFHYGADIEWVIQSVRKGQWAAIGVVVAIVTGSLLVRYVRNVLQRREAAKEAGPVVASTPVTPLPTPVAKPAERASSPRGAAAEVRVHEACAPSGGDRR